MAHKDSDELKTDERYPLGDYSFRIERSSVPGSTNDKIEAICTDKDGKNARKSIQVSSSTQLSGWFVEANETEATVYAIIATRGLRHNVSPGAGLVTLPYPNPQSTVGSRAYSLAGENGAYYCGVQKVGGYMGPLVISERSVDVTYSYVEILYSHVDTYTVGSSDNVTYDGKLYFYNAKNWVNSGEQVPVTAREIVLSILPQIISDGDPEEIRRFSDRPGSCGMYCLFRPVFYRNGRPELCRQADQQISAVFSLCVSGLSCHARRDGKVWGYR